MISTLFMMLKMIIRWLNTSVVYRLSALAPRSHKAVMGCYKNKFADNSKYLFLHWQQSRTIRSIWISADKTLIKQLNNEGYEAYYRWSVAGVYHGLTAKYYVYNSYIGDVNQYLANGAIKVNLWHGSPLKQIEFDISSGPLAKVYHPQTWLEKLTAKANFHQQYIAPDIMLAPSKTVQQLFCSAFKISASQCLLTGNPRSDYYLHYASQPQTKQSLLAQDFGAYSQVILYAPTWRDNAITNPYTEVLQLAELSKTLQANNQLLLLRLHPNEAHFAEQMSAYPHIVNVTEWPDIYPIIDQVDLVISDYSSIYIDALPTKAQIAFFLFDQQQYQSQCRQQYPYAESLPLAGEQLFTQAQLTDYLIRFAKQNNANLAQEFASNRLQLNKLFWQYKGNSLTLLDELVSSATNVSLCRKQA